MVVEIVPHRNLFSSDSEPVPRRRQEREVTPEEAPATSCVKEPPNPRLPVMSGAGGSEVRCGGEAGVYDPHCAYVLRYTTSPLPCPPHTEQGGVVEGVALPCPPPRWEEGLN